MVKLNLKNFLLGGSMFDNKIDAYMIFSEINRYYFTKFESSFGCVLLTEKEKIFFTDFRYEFAARRALRDYEIIVATSKDIYPLIVKELKRLKVKNLGYEDNVLTVNEFKNIKAFFTDFSFKPSSSILEIQRSIKTDEEIEKISLAQKLAEKSLTKILPLIKVGITERDVSAALMYEMMHNGAEASSFDSIVAFGENSACPHHKPCDKKLEKNELILIDFGAKLNGYCSDMTRTFTLGAPAEELKVIYSIVLDAQNYALKNIKAGMTGNEADSFAREFITANGYGKDFGHGLGHGVGLQIHESPTVNRFSTQILQKNMIITIEPGIYIDGLGGVRIEDLAVVTDTGITNLTNFNKNLNL